MYPRQCFHSEPQFLLDVQYTNILSTYLLCFVRSFFRHNSQCTQIPNLKWRSTICTSRSFGLQASPQMFMVGDAQGEYYGESAGSYMVQEFRYFLFQKKIIFHLSSIFNYASFFCSEQICVVRLINWQIS